MGVPFDVAECLHLPPRNQGGFLKGLKMNQSQRKETDTAGENVDRKRYKRQV